MNSKTGRSNCPAASNNGWRSPERCCNSPAWLFLDEATSALDEPSQEHVYELLTERLKDTTIISIAHRFALTDFHGKVLDLAPSKNEKHAVTTLDPPLPAKELPSTALNQICESAPLA